MATSKRTTVEGIRKEDVTCAVCLDVYDDPRLLPCLHTFCKKCLLKSFVQPWIMVQQIYGCPTCRTQHTLSSGVEGLLVSTHIKADVEKYVQENCDQPKVVKCGLCASITRAVKYCYTCDQPLCQQCCDSHRRMKTFADHTVTSPGLAVTKKKPITYSCPKHPNEVLKIYCQQCEEVICADCVVQSHQQHRLLNAKDAAQDIKSKLTERVATVKTKLDEFRSYSETVKESEEHVTTYPDQLKAAISSKFDALMLQLAQRKEELLQSVDTQYDGFSKQLWAEKDEVEMSILGLNAGIKFSTKVMEGSDDVEIAVLGTQALKQMKQLEKKEWDPKVVKYL